MDMGQLSDGSAAISYYDSTQGAVGLAVGRNGNSTWLHQGIDGYPNDQGLDEGDRGKYTTLAVADDGQVWVAFYDICLKTLRYGNKKVIPIHPKTVNGLLVSILAAVHPMLVSPCHQLGSQSYPVICHYDTLQHFAGCSPEWNIISPRRSRRGTDGADETGAAVTANVGEFSSIAIDQNVEHR